MDLLTKQQSQVYSHWKYRPGYMIHGHRGAIFVHMTNSEVVVELQYYCALVPFTELTRTRTPGVDSHCTIMCYIPRPQRLLVVYAASQKVLRAFSVDEDRMIWTRRCEVNGLRFEPKKLLICDHGNNIIVYDGLSKHLVILDPADSSHIQIIPFPVDFKWLDDLQWCKEDLVLLHTDAVSETSGVKNNVTKLEVKCKPYVTTAIQERSSSSSSSSEPELTAPPELAESPPPQQPSCSSPPRVPSAPPLAVLQSSSPEVPPPPYWSLSPNQLAITVSVSCC